jgi:hypothetical protein
MKWLSRRGLLRAADVDASNEARELSPAEALAGAGLARGTVVTTRDGGDIADEAASTPPPRETDAAVYERFNLHATVRLAANDDVGRERLCRYLTRPAFSLARLRLRRDGMVVYRVKNAGRGRVKERVMTPVECLGRLAAMTPPPRYPLLRFHGVLGPCHAWRARVVPRPPVAIAACKAKAKKKAATTTTERPREAAPGDGRALLVVPETLPTSTLTASGAAEQVAPNVLSIAHWKRLHDGELYAPLSRVDWATLLRRTFDVDVRTCPRCGGRLTIRAVITDPDELATVLDSLRRPRAPPTAA